MLLDYQRIAYHPLWIGPSYRTSPKRKLFIEGIKPVEIPTSLTSAVQSVLWFQLKPRVLFALKIVF